MREGSGITHHESPSRIISMAKTLYVEIVAPDRSAYRGEALRFRAPGVEGSFEVLYNHAPMVAAIGVGTTSITEPDGQRVVFATHEGFVEVLDNRVIMVVAHAEAASEIDLERAQAAEEAARARLLEGLSPEERAEAEAEMERARNSLRTAMGQVTRS
jgi:F-type H+-transporting ATPase subunit epsilon